MATQRMIDKLKELQREEALAAAGWERTYLQTFVDNGKTVRACARCGRLPHIYRTAEGMFACGCTACGAATEDQKTGEKAVEAWNKDNKTAAEWRSTRTGFECSDGRLGWEQVSPDGSIETVYK